MIENPHLLRDSSKMADDPLSTILSLVDARAACAGGFTGGGQWSIAFPPPDKIKFFVIARGECWLTIEGGSPFHLRAGDVFLLSARKPFIITTDPGRPPVDAHALFEAGTVQLLDIGGGDDFFFLGGHVDLHAMNGSLLAESLPPTIHLQVGCVEASRLQWLIEQLVHEHREARAGADLACSGLAQLIFLQILRGYLEQVQDIRPGWLRALCDPRIAPVLRLMHGDPARNWHLPELARAAAMSRTAFALHFKAVAGVTPLTYLAQWRMRLAQRRLREGDMPIAALARELGYASEAAFGNAFKRVAGVAPGRYRAIARQIGSDDGGARMPASPAIELEPHWEPA